MHKAERAIVRISSLLPAAGLLKMAATKLIADQHPTPTAAAALIQLIENGQHWMFTPWRTIELVHAVQKPLQSPDIENIRVARGLNQIYALPVISNLLHAKSTARLDVWGAWAEPLDDPANAASATGPISQPHTAHPFDVKIARGDAPSGQYLVDGHQHVFGDTRYRRVTYQIDATTRFREFMPPAIRGDDTQLKVTGKALRTWIPNAAPPPPPSVLYVVPTFGWTRQSQSGQATSMRAGGGLRVYMARPWLASGFGEML